MSSKKHTIAVQERSEFGKNASRRARRDGMVPVNVYSHGKQGTAFLVRAGDWESLSHKDLHLIYLLNGAVEIPVILKEVQHNHLKGHVIHIDFQEVGMNEEVHTELQIHAHGDAAGVARGGILEQLLHHVTVACKPQSIPDAFGADVSALDVGGAIHVGDLKFPEGVRPLTAADVLVFHVVLPRAEAAQAAEPAAEPVATKEKKDKANG